MATIVTRAGKGLPLSNNELDANFVNLNNESAAQQTELNQKADLIGGKIPSSQLPSVAIGETFTVASEAAMLALTAQTGDVAIRTELNNRKFLLLGVSTSLSSWTALDASGLPVDSVNGYEGAVVLGRADIGLSNADNTSDANKPISTAQAAVNTSKSNAVTTTARTSNTGSSVVPAGTTAQRDAAPQQGFLRYNATIASFEGYSGSSWGSVGGGATGAAGDTVFQENSRIVTSSYTISAGKNASLVGPLTVNLSVQVTVPTGARLVVF